MFLHKYYMTVGVTSAADLLQKVLIQYWIGREDPGTCPKACLFPGSRDASHFTGNASA